MQNLSRQRKLILQTPQNIYSDASKPLRINAKIKRDESKIYEKFIGSISTSKPCVAQMRAAFMSGA